MTRDDGEGGRGGRATSVNERRTEDGMSGRERGWGVLGDGGRVFKRKRDERDAEAEAGGERTNKQGDGDERPGSSTPSR